MTLGIEAELREDLRKRSLALDIRNMFNELCRLCAQEDLLESGELVGVDLTLMARYVDIAYNRAHRAWFWVEASAPRSSANAKTQKLVQGAFPDGTLKSAGYWMHVTQEEGVRH
eukprot:COSAG01_NODE_1015_length_12114_cov_214.545651_4_plen_114_part_00